MICSFANLDRFMDLSFLRSGLWPHPEGIAGVTARHAKGPAPAPAASPAQRGKTTAGHELGTGSNLGATSLGTQGAPPVHAERRAEGILVTRTRVARLMRSTGIAGGSPR